jgi:hypothetical protein
MVYWIFLVSYCSLYIVCGEIHCNFVHSMLFNFLCPFVCCRVVIFSFNLFHVDAVAEKICAWPCLLYCLNQFIFGIAL